MTTEISDHRDELLGTGDSSDLQLNRWGGGFDIPYYHTGINIIRHNNYTKIKNLK